MVRSLVRRRATRFALLVVGLFAGWVASAGALPPLPPAPTVPQVPALPGIPNAPQVPRVPQPPAVPAVPKAPAVPRVSRPALPVAGGSGGTASSGYAGGGASPQASVGHTESRPARVYRLHFSRNWISRSGPKQGRKTVLVFTLGKAALVEFVVIELAPDCRRIGRFRVAGQPGVNRVSFRGRIGRRVLAPGTYRIRARTIPRGRALVDTRLIVVTDPEREEIEAARGANTCGSQATEQSSSASSAASGATPTTPGSGTAPSAQDKAEKPAAPSRAKGVLGARFTRAVDTVTGIPLWLFILLGLAIAILAVAALPLRAARNRRAASALAQHRGVFALAGAVALVAVMVAYTMH